MDGWVAHKQKAAGFCLHGQKHSHHCCWLQITNLRLQWSVFTNISFITRFMDPFPIICICRLNDAFGGLVHASQTLCSWCLCVTCTIYEGDLLLKQSNQCKMDKFVTQRAKEQTNNQSIWNNSDSVLQIFSDERRNVFKISKNQSNCLNLTPKTTMTWATDTIWNVSVFLMIVTLTVVVFSEIKYFLISGDKREKVILSGGERNT